MQEALSSLSPAQMCGTSADPAKPAVCFLLCRAAETWRCRPGAWIHQKRTQTPTRGYGTYREQLPVPTLAKIRLSPASAQPEHSREQQHALGTPSPYQPGERCHGGWLNFSITGRGEAFPLLHGCNRSSLPAAAGAWEHPFVRGMSGLGHEAANAGISQVFEHFNPLGGDTELGSLAFTLALPDPPEGASAPAKPRGCQSKPAPGLGAIPSSPWNPSQGHLHPQGYQKTQKSRSSCRDGQPSFPKPAKPPGTLHHCRGNLGRPPQHARHWFRDLLGQWQASSSYPGAGG